MATAPAQDITSLINAVLDRAREDMGIGDDETLGTAIGASDTSIYFWRKGKIGKSARILIPLIVRQYAIKTPEGRTKYGRRRRKPVEV